MEEKILDDFFAKHTKELSKKITESNFINADDLAIKTRVQIKLLVYDFMNLQISNTEAKRKKLIEEKQRADPYLHSRINFEIQQIKDQIKKENIIRHNIESNYRYDLLKKFVIYKFGELELEEFYNSIK